MKKIITLIVAVLFISCSSNDEDIFEGSQSDLTGNWEITSYIFEDIQILDECSSKSTIKVSSDGTAIWNSYLESNGDCSSRTKELKFEAININFDIEDNSSFTNYQGRFYGPNEIQIIEFFNSKNGLETKTVYRFKK